MSHENTVEGWYLCCLLVTRRGDTMKTSGSFKSCARRPISRKASDLVNVLLLLKTHEPLLPGELPNLITLVPWMATNSNVPRYCCIPRLNKYS